MCGFHMKQRGTGKKEDPKDFFSGRPKNAVPVRYEYLSADRRAYG